MHVVRVPSRQVRVRRMYLPSERLVVNGVGLGEVDGFDIGKMFTRMFTFKASSFKPSNIMGAIGSVVSNLGTFGMGSMLAPKTFSAHSSTMKKVGMGVSAAAAAAGIGYGAYKFLPAGTFSNVVSGAGNMLKSTGTILKGGLEVLKTGAQILGGGGKQQAQQGGMTQADMLALQQQQQAMAAYNAQQAQIAAYNAQQQALYNQQQQQGQYSTDVSQQLTPTVYPSMDAGPSAVGPYPQDMTAQGPYSALTDYDMSTLVDPTTGLITDPKTGNKIDPSTGQVVQAGMLPAFSTRTWMIIGGVTLLGLYLSSGSKANN